MKKIMSLMIVAAVVTTATSVSAAELSFFGSFKKIDANSPYGRFVSLQGEAIPPAPAVEGSKAPAAKGHPTAELFHCVRYEDLCNVHPCAVTKIVSIKDPCWKPDPCSCKCQVAPCVLVKICVPPCGCPKVRVTRNGSKVKYDYGKYEVEISSRRGVVKVDYDD
jgi:hypothetical protein